MGGGGGVLRGGDEEGGATKYLYKSAHDLQQDPDLTYISILKKLTTDNSLQIPSY